MPRKKATVKEKTKKEEKKFTFYQAVGRRKEATARVRLYLTLGESLSPEGMTLKKGEILVNKRPIEKYFPLKTQKEIYLEPFKITETLGRFAVSAIIKGGGLSGQLGAFVHGVSRALEKVDKKYRPLLKKRGLLTRDAREKERRKAGFAQKARAKKQSPKR